MMQALIFDMDGVIVDSELHWKSVEGFYLQELVPGWGEEDQHRIIGLSLDAVFRLLSDEYGYVGSKDDFLVRYHAMAEQIYSEKVSLLPGFLDLVTLLEQQGVRIALASSSPMNWISLMLDRFDLRRHFEVVASAQALGIEGKPSPAIYLYTAEKMGVEPSECVVIEDSRNGVLSAKRAGMFCIGLHNGFNDEQDISAADMHISSFTELDWDTLSRLAESDRSL